MGVTLHQVLMKYEDLNIVGVTLPPEPKYYQNYIHCIKILGVTLHQVLMKYEDLNIVGVTLPPEPKCYQNYIH